MRQAGADLVTIGRALRYGTWHHVPDPDEPDVTIEVQASSDDSIARMVRQDIDRGLADRRKHLDTTAGEYITAMTERLERLRAAAWPEALKGSAPHIRECRAIEDQLARLHGLNKPVQHNINLPSAQAAAAAAVEELLSLAALNPAVDLDLPTPAEAAAHG